MNNTLPVVVIGAGLTGLTAAYTLHKAGVPVVVLEASDQVGGVIRSSQKNGFLIEHGPHTFQSTASELMMLCESLGLTPQAAAPLGKQRFIWWHNKLCALPTNLFSFLTTPLLSANAKWRLLQEPFQPKTTAQGNQTVGEWACRRLGPEPVTTMLAPFISGVYAGSVARLGAVDTLPMLINLEQQHGSLVKGMLKKVVSKSKKFLAKKRPYALYNVEDGMQTLPKAMAAVLPDVRLNSCATAFTKHHDGPFVIGLEDGDSIRASHVIGTLPAHALATVLPAINAAALPVIPYAPIAVVHVGLPSHSVKQSLNGFGVLVPRATDKRILGCIFTSQLFPARAPSGQTLLSVFVGGATDPISVDMSDAELQKLVMAELETILNIVPNTPPSLFSITRWPKGIPQTNVGHANRISQWKDAVQKQYPGMVLGGNYTGGVALHHCVAEGQRLAEGIVAQWADVETNGEAASPQMAGIG